MNYQRFYDKCYNKTSQEAEDNVGWSIIEHLNTGEKELVRGTRQQIKEHSQRKNPDGGWWIESTPQSTIAILFYDTSATDENGNTTIKELRIYFNNNGTATIAEDFSNAEYRHTF